MLYSNGGGDVGASCTHNCQQIHDRADNNAPMLQLSRRDSTNYNRFRMKQISQTPQPIIMLSPPFLTAMLTRRQSSRIRPRQLSRLRTRTRHHTANILNGFYAGRVCKNSLQHCTVHYWQNTLLCSCVS